MLEARFIGTNGAAASGEHIKTSTLYWRRTNWGGNHGGCPLANVNIDKSLMAILAPSWQWLKDALVRSSSGLWDWPAKTWHPEQMGCLWYMKRYYKGRFLFYIITGMVTCSACKDGVESPSIWTTTLKPSGPCSSHPQSTANRTTLCRQLLHP